MSVNSKTGMVCRKSIIQPGGTLVGGTNEGHSVGKGVVGVAEMAVIVGLDVLQVRVKGFMNKNRDGVQKIYIQKSDSFKHNIITPHRGQCVIPSNRPLQDQC